MPYYNLKLDLNPIKQGTQQTIYQTGVTTFATESYWTAETNVDMSDERNIIQQYILAYKTALEKWEQME